MAQTSSRYIGLISGTSADGIDAVVLNTRDGLAVEATHAQRLDAALHERLRTALDRPDEVPARELGALDHLLGHAFADAALAVIEQAGLTPAAIRAIGSHGQTLLHAADRTPRFTLQIGDPNVIAARTGLCTVADFRRREMAHGGEGAPLVPMFHRAAFSAAAASLAVINIGGIANVTALQDGELTAGFDTGPGNTLMDLTCRHLDIGPFDTGGHHAASGTVSEPILARLLADPWLQLPAPKSTGPEHFNARWLNARLATDPGRPVEDVLATLAEFTARSIADAVTAQFAGSGLALVCGGGAHNPHLLARLRAHLATSGWQVDTTDSYGIDADWVEAAAFAWLAGETLAGRPGNHPSSTGADRNAVLGAIHPASITPLA